MPMNPAVPPFAFIKAPDEHPGAAHGFKVVCYEKCFHKWIVVMDGEPVATAYSTGDTSWLVRSEGLPGLLRRETTTQADDLLDTAWALCGPGTSNA